MSSENNLKVFLYSYFYFLTNWVWDCVPIDGPYYLTLGVFRVLQSEPIDIPPKWCHVGLTWICHFLFLDPHLKAMGPIYVS
jgi:hypothetical protein